MRKLSSTFAKLLVKQQAAALTHWPPKWPLPPKYHPPTQTSNRSKLRFTPFAAGKIEPWVFRLLLGLQELLEKGENEEALALCHEELSLAMFQRRGQHDCYHRVISLFTRHGDFSAATSLCNRMVEDGFIVPSKTLMVLLRGMHSHDVKHIQQVQTMLANGTVKLDDLAFKSILDSMLLYGSSPKDLETALQTYSATRDSDWIAPLSIYGIIIQSYALAGDLDYAQEWLEKYRNTVPARNQSQDTAPPQESIQVADDPTDVLETHLELDLRRMTGIQRSTEDPRYPYAAVLMGYAKSPDPLVERIDWLFERMRLDGLAPDITMCNILIPTFFRWGWSHRAYAIYQSMISPNSVTSPDTYTFRHLFVALNPRRPKGPREKNPPRELTARELFKDMIALDRLRLYPRKPQPNKNLISTATFNCALGTYTAQGDYAAAWTVLSYLTRYHLPPDAETMRNVILNLLRRMRNEVTRKTNDIIWMDRFMGERRPLMIQVPNKMVLAEHVLTVGRAALEELKLARWDTYLKPSLQIRKSEMEEMKFLAGLLRTSLQASLGFPRGTRHALAAERAITAAMSQARNEMVPRGRSSRN